MATFLERYQAGDRVAVWDELVALGEGVRHKLYYADAVAVAAETMRRARHNVELLIQRLAQAGYRFVSPEDDAALAPRPAAQGSGDPLAEAMRLMLQRSGNPLAEAIRQVSQGSEDLLAEAMRQGMERARKRLSDRMTPEGRERMAALRAEIDARQAARAAKVAESLKKPPLENPEVFDPPNSKTVGWLKKLEKAAGGPMPISVRAWYEQVGGVSLNGSHPAINPRQSKEPSYAADPLMVAPPQDLIEMLEMEEDEDGEIRLWIAPDDLHKANVSGGSPYSIAIPNACADALFEDEWHHTTFVKYLRIAFQWGGFPGWQRNKKWPAEALARLTEGLLPI
jgi:hypothetical protein